MQNFNNLSLNLTAANNMASDGTAPGPGSIQDGVAAEEWINPGTDFHLHPTTSRALGAGIETPEYPYYFDDLPRGV